MKLTPEAPLPTTSTSKPPAAEPLSEVEMVVADAAVFVADEAGPDCTAPDTDVEPAMALETVPAKRTRTW